MHYYGVINLYLYTILYIITTQDTDNTTIRTTNTGYTYNTINTTNTANTTNTTSRHTLVSAANTAVTQATHLYNTTLHTTATILTQYIQQLQEQNTHYFTLQQRLKETEHELVVEGDKNNNLLHSARVEYSKAVARVGTSALVEIVDRYAV